MRIEISIIIPTYKRKEHLLRLFKSLNGNVDDSVEIIVVEQLENNSKTYIKRAKLIGLNFQYIFLDTPSTPHAKNIGVEHAKGKYIVFFDDDVLLKTSIIEYKKSFKTKTIAAVNGRVPTVGHADELDNKDVGRITFWGNFTDGYTSKVRQEIETVIGCNVCWRKDVFLQIGGFDTQFTGNALREEADLSLRARKAGYKILFDPTVEVLHVRAHSGGTRKTEGRMQWYFDFFSNETYFFLKHWPFWSVPLIMLTRWEWALRCMLGFGREVSVRSFVTPFAGVVDGYKKYWRWKTH